MYNGAISEYQVIIKEALKITSHDQHIIFKVQLTESVVPVSFKSYNISNELIALKLSKSRGDNNLEMHSS